MSFHNMLVVLVEDKKVKWLNVQGKCTMVSKRFTVTNSKINCSWLNYLLHSSLQISWNLPFFLSSKTISTLSTLEVELQFRTLGQFNKSTEQSNISQKGIIVVRISTIIEMIMYLIEINYKLTKPKFRIPLRDFWPKISIVSFHLLQIKTLAEKIIIQFQYENLLGVNK